MKTARRSLILLAALILPSCGSGHRRVWVTVHNEGTAGASLWVEGHYPVWSSVEKHEATVQPNESVAFRYTRDGLYRLELRIYRSSDFLKLFEDSWDYGDLDRVDFLVTVTVNP